MLALYNVVDTVVFIQRKSPLPCKKMKIDCEIFIAKKKMCIFFLYQSTIIINRNLWKIFSVFNNSYMNGMTSHNASTYSFLFQRWYYFADNIQDNSSRRAKDMIFFFFFLYSCTFVCVQCVAVSLYYLTTYISMCL